MSELETKEILRSVLGLLKMQIAYLHRQHGWVTAIADAMRNDPALAERLEQHPFYDQGPASGIQSTDVMIQNIDVLIQRLKQ